MISEITGKKFLDIFEVKNIVDEDPVLAVSVLRIWKKQFLITPFHKRIYNKPPGGFKILLAIFLSVLPSVLFGLLGTYVSLLYLVFPLCVVQSVTFFILLVYLVNVAGILALKEVEEKL